jgi:hypothetical protein
METLKHRWGLRYTPQASHNLSYLQSQTDNISDFARRGELFLNEPLQQLYYVDSDGAKGVMHTPAPISNLEYTSTIVPNGLTSRIFKLVLEGNCNILPITYAQAGQEYIFLVYQDLVGLRQITFDSAYILHTQIIPRQSEELLVLRFVYDNNTFIQL